MLSHWRKKYITDLLPVQCEVCGLRVVGEQKLSWLCEHCLAYFAPQPRCQRCGLPTVSDVLECGRCLTSPPLWSKLYCVGDYQAPLSRYVHQLKYERQFWVAEKLAELFVPTVSDPAPLITSVPLHWRRHAYRGFNQSELLAMAIARQLKVMHSPLFKRIRATSPQKGKNRQQRMANLHQVFTLKGGVAAKRVAIVDDVLTTGSTVHHLCKLLLDAGVESVDIYTICRTPEPADKND
ncbi:phosphoribosyltransferase family protein [Vibrio sp. MarTm2]|uniref:ComF family protein n=1 Tax=Vibrio sp. MarTm2 TaxID=2998831 RepID=UPI0022CD8371|nr:phosphoribosyltransferase family protein [Vibrio sp. MarTm2]MDA0130331.1 phosphoribosyltransferase family protein [Vibrio sp. MarTm2]